jgi:hypothetical protein
MGLIASLPCCLCGDTPVQVHHIREGVGAGQRQHDWLTIPLCPSCHTGTNGIHGSKAMLYIMKMDELDCLAWTLQQLFKKLSIRSFF